ncbi:neocarzinostatin apoprotein domain-containing protein [Nocardia sp. XZ_19_385]|uniref:neocarzinostatin apoprotein domain-containing protein n=1 Tax=Nocardia sp. XZ_19_385 TaxID=2769488 RepID=UPI00188DEC96|nr:neocarzinostatin apoprotein domain-containing protein [Nocardia sp. XZ_19_385]
MKHNAFRLAVLAAAACGGLLAAAPAALAAPTLQLDASTGVAAGQTITVNLEGLDANLAGVAVGQCKPQVVAPTDCNLSGSLMGAADAQGVWQPRAGGRTLTLVGAVGGTDCTTAPGACAISVTSLTNPSQILASVPLTFGAKTAAQPTPAAAAPAAESDNDDSNTGMIVGITGAVVVIVAIAALVLMRRRATTR